MTDPTAKSSGGASPPPPRWLDIETTPGSALWAMLRYFWQLHLRVEHNTSGRCACAGNWALTREALLLYEGASFVDGTYQQNSAQEQRLAVVLGSLRRRYNQRVGVGRSRP